MINNYTNTKKTRENPQHRVYGYGIATGCKIAHRTRTRKTRTRNTAVIPVPVLFPSTGDSRHSRRVDVNHHWHNPYNLWCSNTQITCWLLDLTDLYRPPPQLSPIYTSHLCIPSAAPDVERSSRIIPAFCNI